MDKNSIWDDGLEREGSVIWQVTTEHLWRLIKLLCTRPCCLLQQAYRPSGTSLPPSFLLPSSEPRFCSGQSSSNNGLYLASSNLDNPFSFASDRPWMGVCPSFSQEMQANVCRKLLGSLALARDVRRTLLGSCLVCWVWRCDTWSHSSCPAAMRGDIADTLRMADQEERMSLSSQWHH